MKRFACLMISAAAMVAAGTAFAAGDAARGEAEFEVCAVCHGEQGEGFEKYGAPKIGGQEDLVRDHQSQEFPGRAARQGQLRRGRRGRHPGAGQGPVARLRRDRGRTGDSFRGRTALRRRLQPTVERRLRAADARHRADTGRRPGRRGPGGVPAYAIAAEPAGDDRRRSRYGHHRLRDLHRMPRRGGEGNQALNAPAVAGQHDWYTIRQMEHYIAGIRGSDPRNIFDTQMRPMAMVLPTPDAIRNVTAYINSFTAGE